MLSVETASLSSPTAVSSPGGEDKPTRARFEAFVMTGDAILNLSRTTSSSPAFVPNQFGRRRPRPTVEQQQHPQPSLSTPTSPVEKVHLASKDEQGSSPPTSLPASTPIRTSKSEETLTTSSPESHQQTPCKPEERTLSAEKLLEPKEPERIVWTYNAAPDSLSEKERRRYEADQFWLNTRTESSFKQLKQHIAETRGPTESTTSPMADEDRKEGEIFTCDTQEQRPTESASCANAEESPPPVDDLATNVDTATTGAKHPLLTRSSTEESESDADSLQSLHFSPKGVDVPSAIRLAKRLYNLDGFQKSEVSRHLCRNNDWNRVVAEEYLKHFDFEGLQLEEALRRFLNAFQLTGESSERDGVLVHFSRRYLEANPGTFSSQDGVHILTCALLLLNSDLHGKHPGLKRMTCAQFIKRLSGLNDGANFPVDLLRRLYTAIKEHPLEWATDATEVGAGPGEPLTEVAQPSSNSTKELASNPYLDIPAPAQSQEFKKGYIMRKCCVEPGGKRTPLGKRGWRMYFAVLKDLCLYLYKDEATCKGEAPTKSSAPCCKKKTAGSDQQGPTALIRVHHALAASAPDYVKKKNVFRLFTADRAQFLIQASDTKEWRCWMDAVNTAAALLSSPPLAAPCGSQQRFQRPLLPSSLSQLSPREQLMDHEERVGQLERELLDHRANPLPTKAKSALVTCYREKDAYLHFEKTRYEAYLAVCSGLQAAFSGGNSSNATTMSRDVSLLEMDETPNDSGQSSPDFKLVADGESADHL